MPTKEELMEQARELDIEGRSSMSKDELEAAIAEASDADPEPEVEPGDALEDDDDEAEDIPAGSIRILRRFWDRIVREMDDRPSVGEPDLLETVDVGETHVLMPVSTADAFGVHPSLYAISESVG